MVVLGLGRRVYKGGGVGWLGGGGKAAATESGSDSSSESAAAGPAWLGWALGPVGRGIFFIIPPTEEKS